MDDGYLIHESKAYLKECLKHIRNLCEELGIKLNEKKTQIVKLSRGFTWLKIRYQFTESGYIVRKLARKSAVRMRDKLKQFKAKVDAGKMSIHDVYTSLQSWRAYARQFNAYHTIKQAEALFDGIYIKGWHGDYGELQVGG